jgi:DNA-binding response OmpR family regulator
LGGEKMCTALRTEWSQTDFAEQSKREVNMRPCILLIESELTWIDVFKEHLAGFGFDVKVAMNFRESWHWLETKSFDLALVDIALDQSWLIQDFLGRLHKQYPKTPIVAFTNKKLRYSEVFELGKLGVVDFIHKEEFGLPVFGQRIRIALDSSPHKNKPHKTTEADRISILFLAAEPTDITRLRLGEELREIQEKLQLAKLRDQFELYQRMSIRPADISQALLDVQPQIVHFSGHGTATGALCFENRAGKTHPIPSDALASLFEQFADQVNCVLLNACYSETQAKAIAKHIKYVIGMNQAIDDKAAIAFAIGFYQALGAGRKIEEAYKLGCVQIRLQGIPEHLIPVLIKKEQA